MKDVNKGNLFWGIMFAIIIAMALFGWLTTGCLETVKEDNLTSKPYFVVEIERHDGELFPVKIPSELPDFVTGEEYNVRRVSTDFAYLDYSKVEPRTYERCIYTYHFLVTWYEPEILGLMAHMADDTIKYWEYINGIPIPATQRPTYEIIDEGMKWVPEVPEVPEPGRYQDILVKIAADSERWRAE